MNASGNAHYIESRAIEALGIDVALFCINVRGVATSECSTTLESDHLHEASH